ncbi:MAG: DUF4034 domain-containing protein [Planctomycetota bacterium]
MSPRTLASIVVLVVLGIGAAVGLVGFGSDAPTPTAPAKLTPFRHSWPPEEGAPYPALEMRTVQGQPFDFASLRGKVVLIETVALGSPGSVGFAGIDRFGTVQAQTGLASLDQLLKQHGIDRDDPNLRTVHLLLYDSMSRQPSPENAKRWVEQTGLDRHANAIALLADSRYKRHDTLQMVPGFQLLDRELTLRIDGAGANAPHNLYDHLFPGLAMLLHGRTGAAPLATNAIALPVRPDHDDASELFERLAAGDFAGADDVCARLRQAGRAEGTFEERFDRAIDGVAVFPPAQAAIDAWCAERPKSAAAWIASGQRHIQQAWEARGGGPGTLVTEAGQARFTEHLQQAERDLGTAQRIDPTQPFAAARAIRAGLGLARDLDALRARYRAAVTASPNYVAAREALLFCLMPRWGGSFEQMSELVEEAMASSESEPAFCLLLARFHRDVAESTKLGPAHLRDGITADELRMLLRRVELTYPRSPAPWIERFHIARILGNDDDRLAAIEKAAELGDATRTMYLGVENRRVRRDAEGLRLIVQAAARGSVESFGRAGFAILRGEGADQDYALARAWFEAGSRCGDTNSMRGLGVLYEDGLGVDVDLRAARDWYARAAMSNPKGAEAFARLLETHPDLRR